VQVCLRFVQFEKHTLVLNGVGAPPPMPDVFEGVPAAMPAAVEQGLTHAKYWLLQAYEQVEKVGPAGSPVGEDGVGDTTPGVKVVWGWPVPSNTAISVITMHNRTKTISASRNARNAIIAASHAGGRPQ
jgi:hypothetical protein